MDRFYFHNRENIITRISNKISMLANPAKKPILVRSQRISRIMSIVRKMPGSRLIAQITRARISMLWREKGLLAMEKRVVLRIGTWMKPRSQRTRKRMRIILTMYLFLQV